MKVKIRQMLDSVEALRKLNNKELPIVQSFKIAKLTKLIVPELEIFDEKKNELLKKYCEIVDSKVSFPIKENEAIFNKEINELLNIEIEIVFEKIKISDIENINIEPIILIQLDAFLE